MIIERVLEWKPGLRKSLSVLVVVMGFVVGGHHACGEEKRAARSDSALEVYVKSAAGKLFHRPDGDNILAFLVRFENFGCPACLDKFLEFSDSLNSWIARVGTRNIIVMFARDASPEPVQRRVMGGWMKSVGLSGSLWLASADLFRSFGINYTSVFLLAGKAVIRVEFPVDPSVGREILRHFFQPG